MADFFDISETSDTNLLHSEVRTHSELQNVVEKVEWEIIDRFSEREGGSLGNYSEFFAYENGSNPNAEIKVRLIGYDEDTPANSETGLKEALRRTIADVVSWVLRSYDNSEGVNSISQGNRSATFNFTSPSWRDWPEGWKNKLSNYDVKVVQYGI